MIEAERERARVVVVSENGASTLAGCLDAVVQQGLNGTDVVVVDLDSRDASTDIAIRHEAPNRVAVVPPGDLHRVLEAGAKGHGPHPIILLPADRGPSNGWLLAALQALDRAWVAVGPDGDLRHVAIDLPRVENLQLFAGVDDTADLIRRVRAAGGEVTVVDDMRTEPLSPGAGQPAPRLPATARHPPASQRYQALISVVVCTRNRPEQLTRCLASLATLEDPRHEILVIDNNDVPSVGPDLLPARARVVHEPRRGLDRARNTGIRAARGEVVAFIDDDCEADPNWLDGLRLAFHDPQVDAVTGRVRPAALATPPQRWFEAHFSFDRGTTAQRFTPWDRRLWYPLWAGGIGTGCNMAFRRDVISRLGGFDEVLDMGTSIGGGGDLDVFARLVDSGAVLQYTPDALVWHHHRTKDTAAMRQFWGYGRSVGALLAKAVIERRGLRVAAVRFFFHRLRESVRTMRQCLGGSCLVPVRLVLIDVLGQCTGVVAYLAARSRSTVRPR